MQTYDYERSPLGRLAFGLTLVGALGVTTLNLLGWL
jgi:hypothetical protein